MPWHKIVLSRHQVQDWHVELIQRRFKRARAAASAKPSLWAYLPSSRPGRHVDGAEIYLSPGADALVPDIVAEYGAVESEPLARADATLLVGHEADWEQLA